MPVADEVTCPGCNTKLDVEDLEKDHCPYCGVLVIDEDGYPIEGD